MLNWKSVNSKFKTQHLTFSRSGELFIIKIKDAGLVVVKEGTGRVASAAPKPDGLPAQVHQTLNDIKALALRVASERENEISSIQQDQAEIQATLEQLSGVGNTTDCHSVKLFSSIPPVNEGMNGGVATQEQRLLQKEKKLMLNGIMITLTAGMSLGDIILEINKYKIQTGASAAPAQGDEPLKFTLDSIEPEKPFKLESAGGPFTLKTPFNPETAPIPRKEYDFPADNQGIVHLNLQCVNP